MNSESWGVLQATKVTLESKKNMPTEQKLSAAHLQAGPKGNKDGEAGWGQLYAQ